MSDSTPGYYGILTAPVRYDKKLSPHAKILFTEVTALTNMNGYCNRSNAYFAELYDVSIESISRWFSALQKSGHVSIEFVYREGTKEIEERRVIPSDVLTQGSIHTDSTIKGRIDSGVNANNTEENNKTERDALEVFEFWQKTLGYESRKFAPRKKIIVARLKEFSVDDLKKAILGVASSPFHRGENDTRTKYDDIPTIFRNAVKVEGHIARVDEHRIAPPSAQTAPSVEPRRESLRERVASKHS